MASKYARQFALPDGFPQLLKDLTREVLRADPRDIHTFGYEYFSEAISRRNNPDEYAEPERLSVEELTEKVGQLFVDADADGNGVLDRKEFKSVFIGLKEELSLTDKDVLRIMAEADENEDGQIEYSEFLPIAIDVMQSIYAKQDFEATALEREEVLEDVRDYLLHGMPQEELEDELRNVFNEADGDGNGYLDRKEFVAVLKNADLGFTKREINIMLTEVDEDGDGKVSYDEFVPLCFQLLVELVAGDVATVPQDENDLRDFFLELFGGSADEDGKLPHTLAIQLISDADLGLTRVQIHAIMSEAEEDEDGKIHHVQLAQAMSGMVLSLVNVQVQQDRAAKMKEIRAQDNYNMVMGFTAEDMSAALNAAFASVDTSGSGQLAREDIKMVVSETLPSAPPKYVQSIMSLTRPDADGMCEFSVVATQAFKVLQWLETQAQM